MTSEELTTSPATTVANDKVAINSTGTIDLTSHEMFPSLNSIHETYNKPEWGGGNLRSAEAVVRKGGMMITQVFQMPLEHQRKIREEKFNLADFCSTIAKETDTSIDASRSGQTLTFTFVIKGQTEDIKTAQRKLWARLAETITIALQVPEECLGLIIGPQGKKIQALMSETSTRINVPRPYEGQILIAGDFEGISLARQRIESLISDKLNRQTATISIERHYLPFVFSCQTSARINSMTDEFATKHNVKVTISAPKDTLMVSLVLVGERKDVTPALNHLEGLLAQVKKTIKSVSTQVAKPLHRFIIGQKGDTLHALEEESGCYITVPPTTDPSDIVTVYGSDQMLIKGLQAVLEKTSSMDSKSIIVDAKIKRLFLHQSRSSIKELEGKFSVHIHLTGDGFIIDGKKAEVMISAMELDTMLESLLKGYKFDELVVDSAYMKHIIGKKGQNIQQIQTEFGVEIIIDPDNDEPILVAGHTVEAISAAKEHLSRKVTDLENFRTAIIKIDPKFHGALIGYKGTNLKKWQEKYPTVLFRLDDNGAHLRGPSQDVTLAGEELQREAEAIKHDFIMQNYTTELPLTGETLRVAIDNNNNNGDDDGDGNNGGQVTRLLSNFAREHNVKNLTLERKPDRLIIQGLKRDAEAFKPLLEDKLLKMVDRGVETMSVPHEFHSILIGKGGKNVKHLCQKYDVRISFPEATDVTNDIITITGPKGNLKEVCDEMKEFIEYEKSRRNVEVFLVPEMVIPAVLGKGGERINELRGSQDTRIDIGKTADGEGLVAITLEGTKEGILDTKTRIESIIQERLSNTSEILKVEESKFDKLTVIGSAAFRSFVTRQEAQGGVVIIATKNKEFLLRGKVDLVKLAKEELLDLLNEEYVNLQVEVAARHHGEIIGIGGENIKRLCEEFQVTILLPNNNRHRRNTLLNLKSPTTIEEEESPNTIMVSGTLSNVKAVKEELLKYAREAKIVKMPRYLRREIMERFSNEFSELGVNVVDVREGLSISGEVDGKVDQVVELISKALEEAQTNSLVETIIVPQRFHGALIGRNGSQIESLRRESGCRISVPPFTLSSDEIKLTGSATCISKAKVAISDFITTQGGTLSFD